MSIDIREAGPQAQPPDQPPVEMVPMAPLVAYNNGLKLQGWEYGDHNNKIPVEKYPTILQNLNMLFEEKVALDSSPAEWRPVEGKPHLEENYHTLISPTRCAPNYGVMLRTIRAKPEDPQDGSAPLLYGLGAVATLALWPTNHTDMRRVKAYRRPGLDEPFALVRTIERAAASLALLFDELKYAQPFNAREKEILHVSLSVGAITIIAPHQAVPDLKQRLHRNDMTRDEVKNILGGAGATLVSAPRRW